MSLRDIAERLAERTRDRARGVPISQRRVHEDLAEAVAIAQHATYEAAIATWEYRAWKTLAYDLIEVAMAVKSGTLTADQIREAVVTMQRMVDAELRQRLTDATKRLQGAE